MSRRGRKRKSNVKREPSGRVSRQYADSPRDTALAQRVKDPSLAFLHPMAGFPLGRMLLAKQIDQAMYDAGTRWAKLTHDVAVITGIPAPTPRCMDLGKARGKTLVAEPDARKIAAMKADKITLDAKITRACGHVGLSEMGRALISDEAPERPSLLICALVALTRE